MTSGSAPRTGLIKSNWQNSLTCCEWQAHIGQHRYTLQAIQRPYLFISISMSCSTRLPCRFLHSFLPSYQTPLFSGRTETRPAPRVSVSGDCRCCPQSCLCWTAAGSTTQETGDIVSLLHRCYTGAPPMAAEWSVSTSSTTKHTDLKTEQTLVSLQNCSYMELHFRNNDSCFICAHKLSQGMREFL